MKTQFFSTAGPSEKKVNDNQWFGSRKSIKL